MVATIENQHTHFQNPSSTLPSIEEWIATKLSNGFLKTDLFKSMLAVGWKPEQAAQTLKLSADEHITVGFVLNASDTSNVQTIANPVDPAVAFQQAIALKVVPRPVMDAGGQTVDAGDRIVKVLNYRQAPDLMHFEGFLSDAECDALILLAHPKLTRSTTVDGPTGDSKVHEARTSFGMFFKPGETELLARIEARIAMLLSWPVVNGEGMQVLRYLPGSEYKPHFDFFDPHQSGTASILKRGGQRVGTFLMYLNTPDAGGETVFPDIDFSVAPKRGQALFFAYAQSHPCSLSLHGGAPVVAGEKWVATKWLKESNFNSM
jgi:prolyl 4-hydroxylase